MLYLASLDLGGFEACFGACDKLTAIGAAHRGTCIPGHRCVSALSHCKGKAGLTSGIGLSLDPVGMRCFMQGACIHAACMSQHAVQSWHSACHKRYPLSSSVVCRIAARFA